MQCGVVSVLPVRCVVKVAQPQHSTQQSGKPCSGKQRWCVTFIGRSQTELALYDLGSTSLSTHCNIIFSLFTSYRGAWREKARQLQPLMLFGVLVLKGSCRCVCLGSCVHGCDATEISGQRQMSHLIVDSSVYQRPNCGLIAAGFRKWDNGVRLVMDALLSICFTVEKALPLPHFVDFTMCFHNDQLPLSSISTDL